MAVRELESRPLASSRVASFLPYSRLLLFGGKMDLLRALESSLSLQSPADPGLSRARHKSVGYGTRGLGSDA